MNKDYGKFPIAKKIFTKFLTSIMSMTIVFMMIINLIGCGATSRVYLNPNTDLGYLQRVAILPFQNFTNEKYVGEKISQGFIAEMLIAGDFEIVEPGEVNKAFAAMQNNGNGLAMLTLEGSLILDRMKLQKLTEQLECQAVIIGSVNNYEMVRIGSEQFPQISINIRLVDGKTGTIIWMSSFTKRGGPGFPFIGFGEQYTLSELTQAVCRDIVYQIHKKL